MACEQEKRKRRTSDSSSDDSIHETAPVKKPSSVASTASSHASRTTGVAEQMKLGRGRQKSTRTLFQLEEDLAIIEFVATHSHLGGEKNTGGTIAVALCKKFPKIAQRHTPVSIMARLQIIKKNIDNYKVPVEYKYALTNNALYAVMLEEEHRKNKQSGKVLKDDRPGTSLHAKEPEAVPVIKPQAVFQNKRNPVPAEQVFLDGDDDAVMINEDEGIRSKQERLKMQKSKKGDDAPVISRPVAVSKPSNGLIAGEVEKTIFHKKPPNGEHPFSSQEKRRRKPDNPKKRIAGPVPDIDIVAKSKKRLTTYELNDPAPSNAPPGEMASNTSNALPPTEVSAPITRPDSEEIPECQPNITGSEPQPVEVAVPVQFSTRTVACQANIAWLLANQKRGQAGSSGQDGQNEKPASNDQACQVRMQESTENGTVQTDQSCLGMVDQATQTFLSLIPVIKVDRGCSPVRFPQQKLKRVTFAPIPDTVSDDELPVPVSGFLVKRKRVVSNQNGLSGGSETVRGILRSPTADIESKRDDPEIIPSESVESPDMSSKSPNSGLPLGESSLTAGCSSVSETPDSLYLPLSPRHDSALSTSLRDSPAKITTEGSDATELLPAELCQLTAVTNDASGSEAAAAKSALPGKCVDSEIVSPSESPDGLRTDTKMVVDLASQHGVSPKIIIYALLINSGSVGEAVDWLATMYSTSSSSPSFSFVIDRALLEEDFEDVLKGPIGRLRSPEVLRHRAAFLKRSCEALNSGLIKRRAEVVDMIREIHNARPGFAQED
ncbi:uncharacterized protein LOC129596228 [Paramacrobiotus metropolitanus]|uniref:uncharacterized protein LOC129596228 n=1 Tax=Paramacrobiotus metropolitanus TaxID=2943436 RepID=UPI002445ECF7|nr:uncharacterized protein LOC129596228 [Paramacrobiotus metropolitanus]XP_055349430.1 uncharacterized protein LOC129596228 [Paramacrobiotus metropolitanus]